MRRTVLVGAALLACTAAPSAAQSMRDQCTPVLSTDWQQLCLNLADAARTLTPRLGIVASGGNAIPGTASTLGHRLPGSPRVSIALRGSAGRAVLPPLGEPGSTRQTTLAVTSLGADVGVGVLPGVTLLPTVGGFGSIDVLASLGLLSSTERDSVRQESSLTWALGARLGVMRESFTAPGVSVDVLYRSIPDVRYTRMSGLSMAELTLDDQRVLSVRASVGKRVLGVGLTAGAGQDWYRLRAEGAVAEVGLPTAQFSDRLTIRRSSVFANAAYTLTIVNFTGELGWQAGGGRPPDAHRATGKGGLFGGIAVRLAI